MKHSLRISKTEEGIEGLLSLWGDMTMPHAQEIRTTLLEAVDKVDTLSLDLDEIESVDVSFVQLICAAHRECEKNDKMIFLQGKKEGSVHDILQRTGYSKQIGCPAGSQKSCLWKKIN